MQKSLRDLNGRFNPTNSMDRLIFDCPVDSNHSILVALNKPIKDVNEGRFWQAIGTSLDDITLSPSVDCTHTKDGKPSGCGFHGWVRVGAVAW